MVENYLQTSARKEAYAASNLLFSTLYLGNLLHSFWVNFWALFTVMSHFILKINSYSRNDIFLAAWYEIVWCGVL